MQDPYKVLGISRGVDMDTAKKAYRKMAMKYHPDRNPNNPSAEAKFKEIQSAWEYVKGRMGAEVNEPIWVHGSLFSIYKKGV